MTKKILSALAALLFALPHLAFAEGGIRIVDDNGLDLGTTANPLIVSTGSGGFTLSGNLTLQNGETIRNATDGRIDLCGNGSFSECLNIFTDAATDQIQLSGIQSGVTRIAFQDDFNLAFGNSVDSAIQWDTAETNDSLKIATGVGSANTSGYVFLVEANDISTNFGVSTSANPVFRIQSSDATTVGDFIEFFHNQTNPYINTGASGNLYISSATVSASGQIKSAGSASIGWSIVSGANTACNTTCTFACVVGWDTAVTEVAVACTDGTADKCLCAGDN